MQRKGRGRADRIMGARFRALKQTLNPLSTSFKSFVFVLLSLNVVAGWTSGEAQEADSLNNSDTKRQGQRPRAGCISLGSDLDSALLHILGRALDKTPPRLVENSWPAIR